MTTSTTSALSTSGAAERSLSDDAALAATDLRPSLSPEDLAPSTNSSGFPSIAIVGKAGSGKTTAAEYLARQYGYTMLSFASTLKHVASMIWGDGARNDREKLQRLGMAVREIDEDAWVNALLQTLDLATQLAPVVIDDCRLPNEYWALRGRGFVVLRVEATEDLRVDRLIRNGKFQTHDQLIHESETALDAAAVDYTIANVAGQLAFQDELVSVLERERRRVL